MLFECFSAAQIQCAFRSANCVCVPMCLQKKIISNFVIVTDNEMPLGTVTVRNCKQVINM